MKCTDIRLVVVGVDEKTGQEKAVSIQLDDAHGVLEELAGHEKETFVDDLIQFAEDVLEHFDDAGKLEIGSKSAKTLNPGIGAGEAEAIQSVDEVLATAAQKKPAPVVEPPVPEPVQPTPAAKAPPLEAQPAAEPAPVPQP